MATIFLWGGLTAIVALEKLPFMQFGIPWGILGAFAMLIGVVLLLLKK